MKAKTRSVWGAAKQRGLPLTMPGYILNYPVVTAVVGTTDVSHLEENARIGSAFEQLSEEEMVEIRALAQG